MTEQQIIKKTAAHVKQKFEKDSTGHDWWHIYRVWQLAKHIAKEEKKTNILVVELSALLHDIADHKLHGGDTEVGPVEARKWLKSLKVDEGVIKHVEEIVRNISFKSIKLKSNLHTLEGQIVHDADKLDAMGAIGIARAIAWGAANGRLIYSPDIPIMKDYRFEKTNPSNSTGIHHFYEKLLHLKDRMFTKTGKRMALRRHKYMEEYLEQFYAEWHGKI